MIKNEEKIRNSNIISEIKAIKEDVKNEASKPNTVKGMLKSMFTNSVSNILVIVFVGLLYFGYPKLMQFTSGIESLMNIKSEANLENKPEKNQEQKQ